MRDSREHALGEIQNAMAYSGAACTRAMLAIAGQIDTSFVKADADAGSRSEGGGVGFGSGMGNRYGLLPAERGNGTTRVLHLFNPAAARRLEPVEAVVWDWPLGVENMEIVGTDGQPVDLAILESGNYWAHQFTRLLIKAEVPSFGYTTYILRRKIGRELTLSFPSDKREEEWIGRVLENQWIRAEFDLDMCVISLLDKTAGRELLSSESCYLRYSEETTRHHKQPSGWTEGDEALSRNLNREGTVHITDYSNAGGLRRRITYTAEYRDTKINVGVSLDDNAKTLVFTVTADWQEKGVQGQTVPGLKFHVPLGYEADGVCCETPFGVTLRGAAEHDIPARRFVYGVPREGGRGLALLSDSLYGYRYDKNALDVTVLRATSMPDPYPETGRRQNRIGLAVSSGAHMELHELSDRFCHTVIPLSTTPGTGTLPAKAGLVTVSKNAVVSAVKIPEQPAKNELLIRLYSVSDKAETITLEFIREVSAARMCDTLEQPGEPAKINGRKVSVPVNPYSAAAVRVILT